jgi:hypothetical protein
VVHCGCNFARSAALGFRLDFLKYFSDGVRVFIPVRGLQQINIGYLFSPESESAALCAQY